MTLSLVNPDLTHTKSTSRNSLVGLPKKYHFTIMIWGLVLVREMFLKGLIYLMQYVWKNGECVVSFVAALCLYPEMHILSIWISVTSRKKETVLNFDNGKKTRKQKLGFLSRNKPIFFGNFPLCKNSSHKTSFPTCPDKSAGGGWAVRLVLGGSNAVKPTSDSVACHFRSSKFFCQIYAT